MAYVTYEFYQDVYKGNAVPSSDFERLAERASDYLDYITRGKATDMADDKRLQKAACAVAEALQTNEQGGDVASQSVGSWSRSYTKVSKSDEERLLEAVRMYLSDIFPTVRWA